MDYIDMITVLNTADVVQWYALPISMDHSNEGFLVEFSDDNGSAWDNVQTLVTGIDFTNGVRQTPVISLDSGTYNFTTNVKVKFRCDASGNKDDIYIDDIRISAK